MYHRLSDGGRGLANPPYRDDKRAASEERPDLFNRPLEVAVGRGLSKEVAVLARNCYQARLCPSHGKELNEAVDRMIVAGLSARADSFAARGRKD